MTQPAFDPYAWRCCQPDEPSVLLPDGRVLEPLNLGAVLPKAPINPLARLIVSQQPTHQVHAEAGGLVEVAEQPLPMATLLFIKRTNHMWARKELKARGVL